MFSRSFMNVFVPRVHMKMLPNTSITQHLFNQNELYTTNCIYMYQFFSIFSLEKLNFCT